MCWDELFIDTLINALGQLELEGGGGDRGGGTQGHLSTWSYSTFTSEFHDSHIHISVSSARHRRMKAGLKNPATL
jgi:hypothetical protein